MKQHTIVDADWVGQGKVTVFQETSSFRIQFNEKTITPSFLLYNPKVRILDKSTFLLVDVDSEASINAWVLGQDGAVTSAFSLGQSISSLSVNADGIWVGYADEGIFGEGISTEALVCLSPDGAVLLRYNRDTRNAPTIVDCEQIVTTPAGVWMFPSLDHELIHIDREGRVVAYRTPKMLRNSEAMSIVDDIAYFIVDGDVYCWAFGRRERLARFGRVEGTVRGCAAGFIQIDEADVNLLRL